MKTSLALLLLVFSAALPVPAHGQAGEIVLYMDTYRDGDWQCWYDDAYYAGQFVTLYVMHEGTGGATGSRFRLDASYGCSLGYVLATSAYTVTGLGPVEGLTVEYGACLQADILIAEVIYSAYYASAPCASLTPVAHAEAESGEIEVTLCDETVVPAGGRQLTVNPTDQCGPLWCESVPVETSTWGRIKALYRE